MRAQRYAVQSDECEVEMPGSRRLPASRCAISAVRAPQENAMSPRENATVHDVLKIMAICRDTLMSIVDVICAAAARGAERLFYAPRALRLMSAARDMRCCSC